MKKNKKIALLVLAVMLAVAAATAEPAESISVTIPVIGNMKQFEIPDNEAFRFMRELKTGWNLGNTFDAWNNGWFRGSEPGLETYWSGAKTTRKLISAIKEAGFNVIRIPVSWHDHVDEQYNINPVWMNRVKEVTGWAVDEGMYVIVNVHHDNMEEYLYPDSAHYEQSAAYMAAVWKQIAEAFGEYDDHVIFESMNEPRLVGTTYEWSFNAASPDCRDAAECINRLNQLFVDTIRATGGNNEKRYLAVPGYCASPQGVLNDLFRIPEDTADNRIIISVYAYTPYDFAPNTNRGTPTTFDLEKDQSQKSQIATFMNSLYHTYIANGIPVIIDEYGALNKDGNLQDRVNFAAYYTCSASARGMSCIWWDNHAFAGNGEQFGLINRTTCEWTYPEIVESIMMNCMYNRN